MAHFKPLPGDPYYSPVDVRQAAALLQQEVESLQAGGINGIMFSNEGSIPWMTNPPQVTAASMASLIGQVRNAIKVPFGEKNFISIFDRK